MLFDEWIKLWHTLKLFSKVFLGGMLIIDFIPILCLQANEFNQAVMTHPGSTDQIGPAY